MNRFNRQSSEYFENAYEVLAFLKSQKENNMYYDEAILSAKFSGLLDDIEDLNDIELISEHVASSLSEEDKGYFMSIFHRYDYFNMMMSMMA